jgi:ABC-type branched-subunit amino acid transport system substrate-binding protein
VVVAMAGCSSSGGGSGSSGTTQGISAKKVVTLGLTGPTSGPLASAGSIKLGAQAYFDKINKAGGVNGYTFKIDSRDDNSTPSQTVTAVRDLWENDKVFALFAPYGSGPVSAVAQYIKSKKIPTIFPYATSTVMFPDDEKAPSYAFGVNAPYAGQVALAAKYAAEKLGVKKLVLLHTSDDFGNSGIEPTKAAGKKYGFEVEDIGYDSTETNFAPLGQRIQSSGADAILAWAIAGATQVLTAARNAGFDKPIITGDAFRGGFLQQAMLAVPDVVGKVYMICPDVLVTDPSLAGFRDAIAKAYPKADTTQALTGWSWAALLVHAVDIATKDAALTWPALAKAFESIRDYNGEGLHSISFSASDHVGLRSAQLMLLQKGGAWKQVQDWTPLPDLG